MTIPAVADHRADLGAGSGRRAAVLVDQESHQLRRGEEFWQHGATHAAVQTAQQTSTNHIDRGGEDGPAQQRGAGYALRQGKTEGQCKSRNAGGGTKAGGLPHGGGSRSTSATPFATANSNRSLSFSLPISGGTSRGDHLHRPHTGGTHIHRGTEISFLVPRFRRAEPVTFRFVDDAVDAPRRFKCLVFHAFAEE